MSLDDLVAWSFSHHLFLLVYLQKIVSLVYAYTHLLIHMQARGQHQVSFSHYYYYYFFFYYN